MRTLYDDRERLIGDITRLSLADDSNKLQPTAETTRIEPVLMVLESRQEHSFLFPPRLDRNEHCVTVTTGNPGQLLETFRNSLVAPLFRKGRAS
jgi:hypothetical protein